MDDLKNWIPCDSYNAVVVDKYLDNNGKYRYSIQHGQRGTDDTYTSWVCPQKWVNGKKRLLEKNGEPVYVPLSIFLNNDKAKALKIWAAIGEQLKNL